MTTGAGAGLELLTTSEMSAADGLAVEAGVPSLVLMENAGRAVADEAMRLVAPGATIAVLCGPGNNGGDGFVAARLLQQHGFRVRVCLLGNRDALKGDAAVMAGRWQGAITNAAEIQLDGVALIIDALFGAGLSRPIDGDGAKLLQRLAPATPVLAVDVPSGLDGTTGQATGPIVQATRTVTFFRRKPGHLMLPGRSYCGDVVVADIGLPAAVLDSLDVRATSNQPALWRQDFPRLQMQAHKYTRGHAVIVSGPPDTTGAARLGARGALRAGAGLVTVATSRASFPVNAAHLTAIMLLPFEVPNGLATILADKRKNAVLLGPGGGVGQATREMVAHALQSGAAVVLDADALTSFTAEAVTRSGEEPSPFGFLRPALANDQVAPAHLFTAIKSAAPATVVMTPHDGEFKRLFPDLTGSKLERARLAAALSDAVVVLKGPDTVIAAPDGRAAINENAPPWLATAGSGDVLAGFVTGLLAQGMPAFSAACAAVWLHGECANVFGPGLIAEDLPEVLPQVLKALITA